MDYDAETIRRSLEHRLAQMYGQDGIRRTLRNLADDLIGATDPADLPADCREWVDRAIEDAATAAARVATAELLAGLGTRFASAPDDLAQCDLMQAVSRAQKIHVMEVR